MNLCETATQLKNGQASLGIELGSTRIKAVLINPKLFLLEAIPGKTN